MKYHEAVSLIGKVVRQESKLKGLIVDNANFSADKWMVLFMVILKHIDESERTVQDGKVKRIF